MKLMGLILTVIGWVIPVVGLSLTSSNTARFVLCLVGIAVCLVGILGVLNKAYVQRAIWKQ
jgi:hypothetical protein